VSVEVTPSELDIDPELVAGGAIKHVLDLGKTLGRRNRSLIGPPTYICDKRRPRNIPLVRGEKKDVGARGVHLVTLSRMNGLLLHSLDLKGLQFLIEDLTLYLYVSCGTTAQPHRAHQIHDYALVNWNGGVSDNKGGHKSKTHSSATNVHGKSGSN
jgi:hypothetical protein